MRILHVVSGDLWAGAEVQAFTLMSHLARMPETVVAAFLLNEGVLAAKLRAAGIEVFIADERQSGAVGLLMRLHRVLTGWRPDLVHTHRVKENILGAIVNRLGGNVPCVRTVHGSHERCPVRGARGAINKAVFGLDRWCGRALQQNIVAVSEALGRELAPRFGAEKVVVIENGIDPDAARSARGVAEFRRLEPDATHIGIAGRLVEVKRVDLFVTMAALLTADRPERRWRFHVFGDGPLRPVLEALAREVHSSAPISFHGHRADIATCMGGLDVLVNCSDHEGFPMSALEAIALGIPIVAHAVGGLTNVVPQEFLVVRHDPVGYKEGVMRALRDDAGAITARHATATLERFSARRNAERIRALYAQLITEARTKEAK